MANRVGYTDEGALVKSLVVQTELAVSKMRLFQPPLSPVRTTLLAAFVAAEATYDGYPAGGFTATAFAGPVVAAAGGASIFNAENVAAYGPVGAPPVTNLIAGFWLETAAGDMWSYVVFDAPLPMEKIGDGFPLALELTDGFSG